MTTTSNLRTKGTVLSLAALLAVGLAACGDDDGGGATGGETTTTVADTVVDDTVDQAGPPIRFRPLDVGGPLTVAALENGDIQIALLFSSDGAIAAKDFVALEDDRNLQPVENLVVVGREDKMTPEVEEVLTPAMDALTTDELSGLNVKLNIDKEDPADVARGWLEDQGLLTEGSSLAGERIIVGSANFNEQELVASMVSQLLTANGAEVQERFKIGARDVVAPALERGDIDLYVEYVGSYLTFLQGVPSPDLDSTLTDLNAAVEGKNLAIGPVAPAENKNAFVVTRETADRYGLRTVSDLAKVEDQLTLGGPPECPQRPLCIGGLETVYGLQFEV
jgi:osmoprotectant transport system substrate-binding protein